MEGTRRLHFASTGGWFESAIIRDHQQKREACLSPDLMRCEQRLNRSKSQSKQINRTCSLCAQVGAHADSWSGIINDIV